MLRHRVSRGVLVFALCLVTLSCAGPSSNGSANVLPTSPSDPAGLTSVEGVAGTRPTASTREEALFPLLNGTFVITVGSGDRLTGSYVGELTIPIPGRATMRLELTATGGSGAFIAATGTLKGEGGGDLAGEGKFVLPSLSGELATSGKPASKFQATIVGTSAFSCSPADRIMATLTGDGNIATVGHASAVLSHEIGGTRCEF